MHLLPGAIAHTTHALCSHPALSGRLTGLVWAGGFKSTKSMWLSKFQKQQESEAAAAAAAAGGVKQEDAQVDSQGLHRLLFHVPMHVELIALVCRTKPVHTRQPIAQEPWLKPGALQAGMLLEGLQSAAMITRLGTRDRQSAARMASLTRC